MTADSQWPLQQAVFAALDGDAALNALLGSPAAIYDDVPQGSAFPYVVVGQAEAAKPFDTKTEEGMEQTVVIHTWSQYLGMKETKEIMAAVMGALDQQSLSVTGHDLALLIYTTGSTSLEEDGITRHGVQKFKAITQAQ
jgi:hypothetical protein